MESDGARSAGRAVLVLPFDMTRILTGNPATCRTSDGEEVIVRMYTAEELMEASRQAREQGDGDSGVSIMPLTWERAVELTKPLEAC